MIFVLRKVTQCSLRGLLAPKGKSITSQQGLLDWPIVKGEL